MKIYDIRLLRTTTGKEHICFFYKTLPKKRINETIDIFKRNVGLIVNNQINDIKMKEYISEETFVKIMKMIKYGCIKLKIFQMLI